MQGNEVIFKKGSTSGEKALTKGQVEKLIATIDVLNDRGLICLGIDAGIRRGDIIKINKRDVNVEERSVTYYEHKKRRTKTVYIGQNTMTTLKMIIDNNRSSWLFPSCNHKKHISSKTAYNILNKYLMRLNIPKRGFHSLRGTCVKLKREAGWTREEVSKLVGDRPETVDQYYNTPSDEEMKEKAKERAII